MKLFIRTICPEAAVKQLLAASLRAKDLEELVAAQKPYRLPESVICCEFVFARVGVIQFLCRKLKGEVVSREMVDASNELILRGLSDGNVETRQFYGRPLDLVALEEIAAYSLEASHPARVAARLVERLGFSHEVGRRCWDEFERFGAEMQRALVDMRIKVPNVIKPIGPRATPSMVSRTYFDDSAPAATHAHQGLA